MDEEEGGNVHGCTTSKDSDDTGPPRRHTVDEHVLAVGVEVARGRAPVLVQVLAVQAQLLVLRNRHTVLHVQVRGLELRLLRVVPSETARHVTGCHSYQGRGFITPVGDVAGNMRMCVKPLQHLATGST